MAPTDPEPADDQQPPAAAPAPAAAPSTTATAMATARERIVTYCNRLYALVQWLFGLVTCVIAAVQAIPVCIIFLCLWLMGEICKPWLPRRQPDEEEQPHAAPVPWTTVMANARESILASGRRLFVQVRWMCSWLSWLIRSVLADAGWFLCLWLMCQQWFPLVPRRRPTRQQPPVRQNGHIPARHAAPVAAPTTNAMAAARERIVVYGNRLFELVRWLCSWLSWIITSVLAVAVSLAFLWLWLLCDLRYPRSGDRSPRRRSPQQQQPAEGARDDDIPVMHICPMLIEVTSIKDGVRRNVTNSDGRILEN